MVRQRLAREGAPRAVQRHDDVPGTADRANTIRLLSERQGGVITTRGLYIDLFGPTTLAHSVEIVPGRKIQGTATRATGMN